MTLLKTGQEEGFQVLESHRFVSSSGDRGHAQHAEPLVPLERLLLLMQLFAPAAHTEPLHTEINICTKQSLAK